MALKINHLTKDELLYELFGRGVQVSNKLSVSELKKSLHEHHNLACELKNIKPHYSVHELLQSSGTKLSAIQFTLSDIEESDNLLLTVTKTQAKLLHLNIRVEHLKSCSLKDEEVLFVNNLCDDLEKFKKAFARIESKFKVEEIQDLDEKMERSRKGPIKESNLPLGHSTPGGETADEDAPVLAPSRPARHNTTLPPPFLQPPTTHLVQASTASSNFSNMFNKLSNPIEPYLHQIPICDGLDVNLILKFLRSIVDLSDQTNISSIEMFEILPRFCRGPLLNKILEYKHCNLTIDDFHLEVLNTFLPINLRERLKIDLVFRPQYLNEPLAVYISEIKLYHKILKCNLSERSIVDSIRLGISPECRNQIVFEHPPRSYDDLDKLCISCNNVMYNDQVRNSISQKSVNVSRPSPNFNQPRAPHYVRPANQNRYSNNANYPVKVCQGCGKPGHILRQCNNSKN